MLSQIGCACRASQAAPVQDLLNLQLRDRQLLLSLHGNGALRAWDLASQKRVFGESLLADALLDSTAPQQIAAVPNPSMQGSVGLNGSSSSIAAEILVVFGPRHESSVAEAKHQVSLQMQKLLVSKVSPESSTGLLYRATIDIPGSVLDMVVH